MQVRARCWELVMKMQKKDVWKLTNKKEREGKRCIYQRKEVHEEFSMEWR